MLFKEAGSKLPMANMALEKIVSYLGSGLILMLQSKFYQLVRSTHYWVLIIILEAYWIGVEEN